MGSSALMINPLQMIGKRILLTGASSGIGRCTAILLSQLGARIVLVARNRERLQQTLDAMEGSEHAIAPFDMEDVGEIPAWLNRLAGEGGLFDGMVCAAGASLLLPLRMMTTAGFEQQMRVNCQSAVALTAAFSSKRVRQSQASVVLVSSVAGLRGSPARTAYSASKGALVAFARSAAVEMAPYGMRVNCVAPAYVKTEMYDTIERELSAEKAEALVRATQPLGLGTPIDVAYAIAFLLAETGRWITGSVLAVDGGYTAQ